METAVVAFPQLAQRGPSILSSASSSWSATTNSSRNAKRTGGAFIFLPDESDADWFGRGEMSLTADEIEEIVRAAEPDIQGSAAKAPAFAIRRLKTGSIIDSARAGPRP